MKKNNIKKFSKENPKKKKTAKKIINKKTDKATNKIADKKVSKTEIKIHEKELWKGGTFVYPIPAVLVTSGTMENSNIITVAWTGIINTNPPMVYISVRPTRYSYNLILENKEFVINLTTENLVYATDWCGVKSGRDVDKFKEMKLSKQKANFVKAPLIAESPVSIECKVVEIKELGSHTMFMAEVLGINASKEYIDENGAFDISKCNLIAYSNGGYYSLGNKIGKFGYSVAKNNKKM
jgi:flavin reductase (DIM6/NTAB) family NADH-FMN oxidoreductase RutF